VFLIEDFCLRRRPLGREGQWEQEAVILEQGIQVRQIGKGAEWEGSRKEREKRESLMTIVLSLSLCRCRMGGVC
jgi:hypothetical protein